MSRYLATQIIAGRLSYSLVKRKFPELIDSVIEVINQRGYMIDDEGNCVRAQKGDTQ